MAAEKAAKSVKGVKAAAEVIVVQYGISDEKTDAEIAEAIVDASDIKVDVKDHIVKLTGTVCSIKEKGDAERAAFLSPGISEVKNLLRVQVYPEYV